jgi:hypothetical protein
MRFFREKGHSLSVAPEPLAIWNKRLEGLESFELKKLKIFPKGSYPAAPSLCLGSFIKRTQTNGTLLFIQVVGLF